MIDRLRSPLDPADRWALAGLILDAVAGNASVGYPAGVSASEAERSWIGVESDVAAGRVILLAARLDGRLVGTVQLRFPVYPTGRHRAEVAKLLVHSSIRGQGIGEGIMTGLEDAARQAGRRLLYLDTEADSLAERLYLKWGWVRVGIIPDFAYRPDGALTPTTVLDKILS